MWLQTTDQNISIKNAQRIAKQRKQALNLLKDGKKIIKESHTS